MVIDIDQLPCDHDQDDPTFVGHMNQRSIRDTVIITKLFRNSHLMVHCVNLIKIKKQMKAV